MNDLFGKRILVTGGAGFIGSFIVDRLIEEGAGKVIILDNLIRGSERNIEGALRTGKAALVKGDIRDLGLLSDCVKGAEYCFHMAALRITHCSQEPREAFGVMYEGTFNVLEACVKHSVKKIVAASSASIYGMADIFPTREDHHPYNNFTLYGAAKASNELMLRSFREMYGLEYVALRFFNVYGPRMDIFGKYTEVLIKWYHMLKEGKQPLIYGDGKQTMDFIYVEDIARAAVVALKSDVTDEAFNIAGGRETSLEDLCGTMMKVMGKGSTSPAYIPVPPYRGKVEVRRRLADVVKAREILGFKVEVSLEKGLERLVEWLKSNEGLPGTC
ncbi:MAG: NAD-dependent epimerase/dehydratase family protein [Candidatus Omnitrophica bacterium]|nr:NAD-dependent epimerase/dehydratase family protein [Candidatus Omnitrophota bacterium]